MVNVNNASTSTILFREEVPLDVKRNGAEAVRIAVNTLVRVDVDAKGGAVLEVQLTSNSDPFFLFSLTLARDDFDALRETQSLLVGFDAFGGKLVELLEECLACSDTRFVAHLHVGAGSVSKLSIVETNSFKHIVHLSLDFVAGNDTAVKNHLAGLVKGLKHELASTRDSFSATDASLTTQLSAANSMNATLKSELDALKILHAEQASRLELQYSHKLTKEKDDSQRSKDTLRSSMENERRDLERSYESKIRSLNHEISILQSSNATLQSRIQNQDGSITALQERVAQLDSDISNTRHERDNALNDHKLLFQRHGDSEKTILLLRERVQVLENILREREDVLRLVETENGSLKDSKAKIEESLEAYKAQHSGLEEAFKTATDEINKGNEIIRKIQADLKAAKAKTKLKNVVTLQQEKLLDERASLIEMHEKELSALRESEQKHSSELISSRAKVEELGKLVDEGKKIIAENAHVIEWLHKQLNEEALNKPGFSGGGAMRIDFDRYGSTTSPSNAINYSKDLNQAVSHPSNVKTAAQSNAPIGSGYTSRNPAANATISRQRLLSSSPTRSMAANLYTRRGPSPIRDMSSLNTMAATGGGAGGMAGGAPKPVNATLAAAASTLLKENHQGGYGSGTGNRGYTAKKSNYF
ncbi:hypothetical protein BJ741DRAFT_608786 [Chytriomyces cf. hyalinus JEL632]|nr:hypothetical protein BJ741DRAFT_608786 [Chytriomyces cf. hyalinus JEL632]